MIPHYIQKVKTFLGRKDLFILITSVLLSATIVGAFQLLAGRKESPLVTVRQNAFEVIISDIREKDESKVFMASKSGTKYYPDGCKAGNRIKPENRIYFVSIQEAQKAGYTIAKNCTP